MDQKSLEDRVRFLENQFLSLDSKLDQLLSRGSDASVPLPRPDEFAQAKAPVALPKIKDSEPVSWLLPLIGMICFVLAGVFIVRLAIESGWLTSERQWGLLVLFGIALTSAGRFWNGVEKDYRTYLTASGIIVLYIAAFSSALYFELVSNTLAIVLGVGVSAICLEAFRYHKSELFPILVSVGTYISPILLGSVSDLYFDAAYFIIWAFLFSYMAEVLKSRTLSLTAAYLGIGVFTLRYSAEMDPGKMGVVIAILVVQFLLFCLGVYLYSIRNNTPLSQKIAIAYLPVLLFFYGTAYYFVSRLNSDLAPWISLMFAGIVYGLYRSAVNRMTSLESKEMVQSFLAVILFHSGYLQILPETVKPWLLPTLLLLKLVSERKKDFPKISKIFAFVFLAVGIIEFAKICYFLVNNSDVTKVFPGILTLALGLFYYFRMEEAVKDKRILLLGLIHLLAILCIYRVGYDFGSLAVSVGWGAYASVILLFAYFRKDSSLAKSSLLVLIVAAIKALVYDSIQAPSALRIGSLIVTGALLYGSGIIFRRIKHW